MNISNNAIVVNGVSKRYALYNKPSDRLKQLVWEGTPTFLRQRIGRLERQFYTPFWALRDVSFSVKKGEMVGIVGRNGSGKSTLLQIIAGTLTPTHGAVETQGQVAALLELGSGFSPEFTGRENVYMNGAIWGLTNREIDQLYPKIVAFADIGAHIDQPVKFYSSGMFVRLAFAVQVFVPKQVLIVDEALSVGDSAFQRKCMVQLARFRESGGTVLFVSHDTQMIIRHCQHCLLLSRGELVLGGPSKLVTDVYQKTLYSSPDDERTLLATAQASVVETTSVTMTLKPPAMVASPKPVTQWFDPHLPQPEETSYTNGHAQIVEIGMWNDDNEQVNILVAGERYRWQYRVKFYEAGHAVTFGMMIKTVEGLDVAGISTDKEQISVDYLPQGCTMTVSFELAANLGIGDYFLNCGVMGVCDGQESYLHRRVDVAMVRVVAPDTRQSYGLAYLCPKVTLERTDD